MTIDELTNTNFTDSDSSSFEAACDRECNKARIVFTYGSDQYTPQFGERLHKTHWKTRGAAYYHMQEAIEGIYKELGRKHAVPLEIELDSKGRITRAASLVGLKRKVPQEEYL